MLKKLIIWKCKIIIVSAFLLIALFGIETQCKADYSPTSQESNNEAPAESISTQEELDKVIAALEKSETRMHALARLIRFASHRLYQFGSLKRPLNEILLSESENAYNPIPNRDGTLIAYVRTGWGREGGSGGFGRSNLRSEVMVMGYDGTLITQEPIADAFLSGWTSDHSNLICYRDGLYFLVSVDGKIKTKGQIPNTKEYPDRTERVSYLPGLESLVWSQNEDYGAFIQTPLASIAKSTLGLGEMVIPSPDGRYIAITGAQKSNLRVYDLQNDSWSNLGAVTIHPYDGWDYIKPSWDPWFSDSSRLAFISGSSLVIVSPNGQNRQIVTDVGNKAGLAVPSPDGQFVAYATFEDRPRKLREDLKFWGNSTLWVISNSPGTKPYPITGKNQDTTYCLRWLSNNQLVFDRIADEPFYRKSRLWKAEVPR